MPPSPDSDSDIEIVNSQTHTRLSVNRILSTHLTHAPAPLPSSSPTSNHSLEFNSPHRVQRWSSLPPSPHLFEEFHARSPSPPKLMITGYVDLTFTHINSSSYTDIKPYPIAKNLSSYLAQTIALLILKNSLTLKTSSRLSSNLTIEPSARLILSRRVRTPSLTHVPNLFHNRGWARARRRLSSSGAKAQRAQYQNKIMTPWPSRPARPLAGSCLPQYIVRRITTSRISSWMRVLQTLLVDLSIRLLTPDTALPFSAHLVHWSSNPKTKERPRWLKVKKVGKMGWLTGQTKLHVSSLTLQLPLWICHRHHRRKKIQIRGMFTQGWSIWALYASFQQQPRSLRHLQVNLLKPKRMKRRSRSG